MHHLKSSVPIAIILFVISLTGINGQERALRLRYPGENWALIIGVNKYVNLTDLQYCSDDSRDLKKALVGSEFSSSNVLLMNDACREAKYMPFASNIRSQIQLLFGKLDTSGERIVEPGLLTEADSVILTFSGHGVQLAGANYLCPADADVTDTRTLISAERLFKHVELCPARVKLVLIDACRNTPLHLGQRSTTPEDGNASFAQSLLQTTPKGVFLMCSCAPGQAAHEDSSLENGVFMNYYLEGLGGAADYDGDQIVSLLEVCNYASSKTRSHVAKRFNKAQTPEYRGRIIDFPLRRLSPRDSSRMKPSSVSKERVTQPNEKVRYRKIDFAQLRTGDLPAGWDGDMELAVQNTPHGKGVTQRAAGVANLRYPSLNVRDNFFIEFTTYLGGWDASLACTLVGDGDSPNINVDLSNPGSLESQIALKSFAKQPLTRRLRDYKHTIRIEVKDGRLRLLGNGTERQAIRWNKHASYSELKLRFSTPRGDHPDAVQFTSLLDFETGPL